MSAHPLVSIIIPTYNYGRYVRHAIDSALKQTYPNIEIIVVDDGSSDDTQAVLAEYGGKICSIRQENQGASAARNRGIREARGDYIAFLDADDAYRVENIKKKVAYLQSHPEYAWCYSDWVWVDEQGKAYMLGSEPEKSLAHLKARGDVLQKALLGYLLGTNVFLFSRRVIDTVEGFDESLAVREDYDLYVRASANFAIGYVDQVLCEIFSHSDSLGTGCSQSKGYLAHWRLCRKLEKLYPDKISQIPRAWHDTLSDLYRNLAELALAGDHPVRAMVLLRASVIRKWWQPGIVLLWWRIKRRMG